MDRRLIILLPFLFVSVAQAVPSLTESNDYFSSFLSPSDENLTQSLELSSTRNYDSMFSPIRDAASFLPQIACGTLCPRNPQLIGFGFGQQIWTPDEKRATTPVPGDEPYAGWMYLRLTRMNMMPTERIETSLYAGMIGPSALGEQTQNGFHDIVGQTHFEGWEHQLHNEPAFYLNHKRGFIDYRIGNTWGAILLTTIEGNLGTVHTDTTLKEELRAGYNLRGYNLDNKEFSVYGFLRPGVSGILRNIFFDGNTFLDSVRVRKENFQAGLEGGIGIEYYGWRVMYVLNFTTKDFETQDEKIHGTGSIRIEKLFEEWD